MFYANVNVPQCRSGLIKHGWTAIFLFISSYITLCKLLCFSTFPACHSNFAQSEKRDYDVVSRSSREITTLYRGVHARLRRCIEEFTRDYDVVSRSSREIRAVLLSECILWSHLPSNVRSFQCLMPRELRRATTDPV